VCGGVRIWQHVRPGLFQRLQGREGFDTELLSSLLRFGLVNIVNAQQLHRGEAPQGRNMKLTDMSRADQADAIGLVY
jgi:hypothetical protein